MAIQQKHQILSNKEQRRLSNIMLEKVNKEEILEIIEQLIKDLKSSK